MVIRKVKELLADIISADAQDIETNMTLTKDNGVEPLDKAKLMIACEKEFKITIHDEDVHAFRRVRDLAAYIDQTLSDGLANPPEFSDEDRTAWYYE